jgi:hypothetical protein
MTIDTSRTLEIAGSRAKLAGLFALGILMTGLSAAIALRWLPDITAGSLEQSVGWLGVLFFGLGTCMGLWRLLSARAPVLTITPEGIRDTRVAAEFLPWTAIQGISTWQMAGQSVMVLAVDPTVESRLSLTALARWSRGANRSLGADGLCITAQGLQIDYDSLFATAVAYVEAAQQRQR